MVIIELKNVSEFKAALRVQKSMNRRRLAAAVNQGGKRGEVMLRTAVRQHTTLTHAGLKVARVIESKRASEVNLNFITMFHYRVPNASYALRFRKPVNSKLIKDGAVEFGWFGDDIRVPKAFIFPNKAGGRPTAVRRVQPEERSDPRHQGKKIRRVYAGSVKHYSVLQNAVEHFTAGIIIHYYRRLVNLQINV